MEKRSFSAVRPVEVTGDANRTQTVPLEAIREAINSIRFGSVQIIIQDGRVVQIDKTEKVRLT